MCKQKDGIVIAAQAEISQANATSGEMSEEHKSVVVSQFLVYLIKQEGMDHYFHILLKLKTIDVVHCFLYLDLATMIESPLANVKTEWFARAERIEDDFSSFSVRTDLIVRLS